MKACAKKKNKTVPLKPFPSGEKVRLRWWSLLDLLCVLGAVSECAFACGTQLRRLSLGCICLLVYSERDTSESGCVCNFTLAMAHTPFFQPSSLDHLRLIRHLSDVKPSSSTLPRDCICLCIVLRFTLTRSLLPRRCCLEW